MLGVATDVQKTLGRGMKEERIEHTGILKDEGAEFVRQGGNRMDVRCGQDFSLSIGEPGGLGGTVTFGTVPVAARVICRFLAPTVITLSEMSAEGRGAA
jgi:S1-C subfamily serine protease